ncbi:hypothetical protein M8818_006375 [Zalaria obscura]|uniref:Uncharacterized protein n=1 Tax=Zalaria obscura TaxID=2024903 RepID=A0ACC3S7E9_9PEZI
MQLRRGRYKTLGLAGTCMIPGFPAATSCRRPTPFAESHVSVPRHILYPRLDSCTIPSPVSRNSNPYSTSCNKPKSESIKSQYCCFACLILLLGAAVPALGSPYQWRRQEASVSTELSATTTNSVEAALSTAPAHSGISEECVDYYVAESDDTCASIAELYEIPEERLITLNPSLGDDCQNITTGYKYCVSSLELDDGTSDSAYATFVNSTSSVPSSTSESATITAPRSVVIFTGVSSAAGLSNSSVASASSSADPSTSHSVMITTASDGVVNAVSQTVQTVTLVETTTLVYTIGSGAAATPTTTAYKTTITDYVTEYITIFVTSLTPEERTSIASAKAASATSVCTASSSGLLGSSSVSPASTAQAASLSSEPAVTASPSSSSSSSSSTATSSSEVSASSAVSSNSAGSISASESASATPFTSTMYSILLLTVTVEADSTASTEVRTSSVAVSTIVITPTASAATTGSSTASSTSSEALPTAWADSYCPSMAGETYTDPEGIEHLILCDTSYHGDVMKTWNSKRAVPTSLTDCMEQCNDDVTCIGTAFDSDAASCTMFSLIGEPYYAEGVSFAVRLATDDSYLPTSSSASDETASAATGSTSAAPVTSTVYSEIVVTQTYDSGSDASTVVRTHSIAVGKTTVTPSASAASSSVSGTTSSTSSAAALITSPASSVSSSQYTTRRTTSTRTRYTTITMTLGLTSTVTLDSTTMTFTTYTLSTMVVPVNATASSTAAPYQMVNSTSSAIAPATSTASAVVLPSSSSSVSSSATSSPSSVVVVASTVYVIPEAKVAVATGVKARSTVTSSSSSAAVTSSSRSSPRGARRRSRRGLQAIRLRRS